MAIKVEKLFTISSELREPFNGPAASSVLNGLTERIASDIESITNYLNRLFVILDTLPDADDISVWDDEQFDGTHLFVDNETTKNIESGLFWNLTKSRPKTIKEVLQDLKQSINDISGQVEQVSTSSSFLTTAAVNKIGINIFNETQASASSSLDSISKINVNNIAQLAKDMYGASYQLSGTASAILTNSVKAMTDALLELHGGNWSDNIVLSHNAIAIPIDWSTIDFAFVGTPTNVHEAISYCVSNSERRLEVNFTGHTDPDYPVTIHHNKNLLPIVQVNFLQETDYGYRYVIVDENEESVFQEPNLPNQWLRITHPNRDTVHIWTNVSAGIVILLF